MPHGLGRVMAMRGIGGWVGAVRQSAVDEGRREGVGGGCNAGRCASGCGEEREKCARGCTSKNRTLPRRKKIEKPSYRSDIPFLPPFSSPPSGRENTLYA
jgi:hypothetical protein